MSDFMRPTPSVQPDKLYRKSPLPTIQDVTATTRQPEMSPHAKFTTGEPSAAHADARRAREAILQDLHAHRRELIDLKRSGKASKSQEDYLAEVLKEIDHWELEEATEQSDIGVWTKLDEIAAKLLGTLT